MLPNEVRPTERTGFGWPLIWYDLVTISFWHPMLWRRVALSSFWYGLFFAKPNINVINHSWSHFRSSWSLRDDRKEFRMGVKASGDRDRSYNLYSITNVIVWNWIVSNWDRELLFIEKVILNQRMMNEQFIIIYVARFVNDLNCCNCNFFHNPIK